MAAITIDKVRDRFNESALGKSLLVYLPLCWVVLQVAALLVDRLGLPDWVFAGTLALLGAGLAAVVWSALGAGRAGRDAKPTPDPAANDPTGSAETPRPPQSRRFGLSHRGLALSFVAVLALWALLTAGYMAARASGVGPFGALVASGAIAANGHILIADFANRTDDADLDETVRQAVAIDLGQSRLVRVVDARAIAGALRRMDRPADSPLTPDLARELAQREGYAAVLEGDIASLGPATLLTARLVAPADGRVLASFEERAREPDQLLDAVDRLIGDVRGRVGESLRTLRAEPPLEQVTTASLPALRLYSLAIAANNAGDRERVVTLLQGAVDLDPRFAMAWRRLGLTLTNLGRDPARAEAALRTAYAHRDRLTVLERGLTEGAYWTRVAGDTRRARDVYEPLAEAYPNNVDVLNALSVSYMTLQETERALELNQRLVRLPPPRVDSWFNLVWSQTILGRFTDAAAAIEAADAQFPGHENVLLMRYDLALARQDWPAAEAAVQALRRRSAHDRDAVRVAEYGEVTLLALRGRLRQAAALRGRIAEQDAADGSPGAGLELLLGSAFEAWLHGDLEGGRALRDRALSRFPLDAMRPAERPHFALAELSAAIGDPAAAREQLAAAAAAGRRDTTTVYDRSQLTAGLIAQAEGRPEEAVDRIVAAGRYGQGRGYPLLVLLGRALEAAGRPAQAREVYRRRIGAPDNQQPDLGFALERLVALDAAAGDRAAAADAARRLQALWTAPEMASRVAAARALAARAGEIRAASSSPLSAASQGH